MAARAKQTKPARGEAPDAEASRPPVETRGAASVASEARTEAEPGTDAAEAVRSAALEVETSEDGGTSAEPTGSAAAATTVEMTVGDGAGELAAASRSVLGFWLALWPEQLADNIRAAQALAGCRSLGEAVEIQQAFVGAAIERWSRIAG